MYLSWEVSWEENRGEHPDIQPWKAPCSSILPRGASPCSYIPCSYIPRSYRMLPPLCHMPILGDSKICLKFSLPSGPIELGTQPELSKWHWGESGCIISHLPAPSEHLGCSFSCLSWEQSGALQGCSNCNPGGHWSSIRWAESGPAGHCMRGWGLLPTPE